MDLILDLPIYQAVLVIVALYAAIKLAVASFDGRSKRPGDSGFGPDWTK